MTTKVKRTNAHPNLTAAGFVLLPLALALMPWWGEPIWMRDLVEIGCYFIFALMWNLLAGYGGMVSVGQQAYFGIGGYCMVALSNLAGVNPFLAIPVGGLLAGLVALPVSRVAFRLQGGYFAIGTWAIAEVFRLTVANVAAVGGGSGTSLTGLAGMSRGMRENLTFFAALSCVTVAIALIYCFLRSKRGLALLAIRDNEVAAESQGVAVRRMKLAVYLVAAFGAGLAGALYFVAILRISPDAAFGLNWTAFAIFMVVIGGTGTIEGPILGAVVFWALNKFCADFGSWYLIGLGLIAIVVSTYFKEGLWGWLHRRFGWTVFPVARILED